MEPFVVMGHSQMNRSLGRFSASILDPAFLRSPFLSMPSSAPSVLPNGDPSSGSLWIVPLPAHAGYDHVRLARVFADEGARHEVVVVDVRRLLQCADRDDTDYVLKPVDEWHAGKVRGIREFLDPSNERIPQMPYVTVSRRRVASIAGWFGLAHEGVVAFRNGQHRARYLAYAGALWLPVEAHEREAPLLRELCGVALMPEYGADAGAGLGPDALPRHSGN